jgi:hypothetical protein
LEKHLQKNRKTTRPAIKNASKIVPMNMYIKNSFDEHVFPKISSSLSSKNVLKNDIRPVVKPE